MKSWQARHVHFATYSTISFKETKVKALSGYCPLQCVSGFKEPMLVPESSRSIELRCTHRKERCVVHLTATNVKAEFDLMQQS